MESCLTFYRPFGKGGDGESSKSRGCGRMNRIYGKANHEPGLLEKATKELFIQNFVVSVNLSLF